MFTLVSPRVSAALARWTCMLRRLLAVVGWAIPQPSARSGPMPAVVRLSTCPAGRVAGSSGSGGAHGGLLRGRAAWWCCLGLLVLAPRGGLTVVTRVPRFGGLGRAGLPARRALTASSTPTASLFHPSGPGNARGGASIVGGDGAGGFLRSRRAPVDAVAHRCLCGAAMDELSRT